MSTEAQIAVVYHEDQRHPYYSLNSGAGARRMGRQERRNQWIWGHFAAALRQALGLEGVPGQKVLPGAGTGLG